MIKNFKIKTSGEGFYNIQKEIEAALSGFTASEGELLIFTPHTSCALTICESYDPQALLDVENFLKHLAPRNLSFIKHKEEGEDDSPSHMKSTLLQPSLSLIIQDSQILLGIYQGIFLAEFRDGPKERTVYIKATKNL